MLNFVEKGNTINYTVPGSTTIASGDAVLVGTMIGIAQTDGVTGDVIALDLTGVFELPKATGVAVTLGAKMYWVVADSNFTPTASTNILAGHAFAAQASGDTTVLIRLSQNG